MVAYKLNFLHTRITERIGNFSSSRFVTFSWALASHCHTLDTGFRSWISMAFFRPWNKWGETGRVWI